MMKQQQAELEIFKRIGQFTAVDKDNLRIENQPTRDGMPFKPPSNQPWCRVHVNYGDSGIASIGNGPNIRDYGFISIQCFAPLNTGTITVAAMCDEWRELLQSYTVSHLEIYKVHAPRSIEDKDFYAKIIRAEFRVN